MKTRRSNRGVKNQEVGREGPSSLAELGRRIEAVVDRFKTRKAAAEHAGITPEQLARYIRGENQAGFLTLARMAMAAGVSLEWLATGEGEIAAPTRATPDGMIS